MSGLSGRRANVIHREDLHFAEVDELEIFSRDGIFVTAAQEAHVVGVFEIFKTSGIAPKFFEITFHATRILDAAVDQFILAIAFNLLGDLGCDGESGDGHQDDHQHDGKQEIAGLRLGSVLVADLGVEFHS